MTGDRTSDKRALTICKETVSGVVSIWQAVIVWATRSTSDGDGAFVCEPLGVCEAGDSGGEGNEYPEDASAKKE